MNTYRQPSVTQNAPGGNSLGACPNSTGTLLTQPANQVRRNRQHNMRDGSHHSQHHAARDQPRQSRRQRHQQQCHDHRRVHPHHQRAPLQHIAQRHKQQQSQRVPHLRRPGHKHHLPRRRAVRPAHIHQQRLVEVDGRHTDSTRQTEEVQRSARRAGLGLCSHSQDRLLRSSVSPGTELCRQWSVHPRKKNARQPAPSAGKSLDLAGCPNQVPATGPPTSKSVLPA